MKIGLKHITFSNRFFWYFGLVAIFLGISYHFKFLYPYGVGLLFIGVALTFGEWLYLFALNNPFEVKRELSPKLSLGEENKVKVLITNNTRRKWLLRIIDELPYQLQERNFQILMGLKSFKTQSAIYTIRPVSRGEYKFGAVNIFFSSPLNFIERREVAEIYDTVAVFPSIIQMKRFELMSMQNAMQQHGLKKVRRIGHSYEFEQIRAYSLGDDVRNINWKATARASNLRVNQYEEERAQKVYAIIDRSRIMKMPFDNLSLLDYSINSTLTIANSVLRKGDKMGLISYAERIKSNILSENRVGQLGKLMNALYKETQSQGEADYNLLYKNIQLKIRTRSLLFMFTNFESIYGFRRVLPYLRRLNKSHLLVIVFFKNTEVNSYLSEDTKTFRDIYHKTAAQEFLHDKEKILKELNKHKIQSIFTTPEELTINTLNKYLELKARGMI